MKILCKEPKKDIGIILKKQKFLFVIKKPNSASVWQCGRVAVRAHDRASMRQCGSGRVAWRVHRELCWQT